MLLRVLPGGSPQLRFYVHLNVNRAMTHAAELFFFFFNATSCPLLVAGKISQQHGAVQELSDHRPTDVAKHQLSSRSRKS